MSKFLIEASLTTQGVKGVQAEGGSARREAVKKALESVSGQLEAFYFCFGEYDGVVIYEVPDDTTTTAIAMAATSAGHLKASHTTKLFTVEETMEAMRKAGSLTFQGPSRG